jgi:hypothetical protein
VGIESGLWPSEVVLPAAEQARRGVALAHLRLFRPGAVSVG